MIKTTEAARQTSTARLGSSNQGGATAIIGPSIVVEGDVSGSEDLMIQGRVEGKVDLAQNHLTIGPQGRVKAQVFGKTVILEGKMQGDLHGTERVILRASAKMEGNIESPCLVIEDGGTFRGGIDMGGPRAGGKASR